VPAAAAFAQVMRRRRLDASRMRDADWHVRINTRDDWGGFRDTLSALFWEEGYQVYGYGDSAFPDGFGALAERLAQGLAVRLNTAVSRVKHGANGVTVTAENGEYRADAA